MPAKGQDAMYYFGLLIIILLQLLADISHKHTRVFIVSPS